jgi:hypothetical protein
MCNVAWIWRPSHLAERPRPRNNPPVVRNSRWLALLGLVGTVAIGATVVVRTSAAAPRALRIAVVARSSAGQQTFRKLQPFLIAQPSVRHEPVPRLAPPLIAGQTCFVGPGTCSETPCVIPVQGGAVTAVASVPVAVAVSPVLPVARTPSPALARRLPSPTASCPQRSVVPQTLRVVGR